MALERDAHPYRYTLIVVVPMVGILALALAALSGDLSTFPVWFAYKLVLWGSIMMAFTWWRQRQRREAGLPKLD